MKNIRIFYLKILRFLVVKLSVYLNRHIFVIASSCYWTREEVVRQIDLFKFRIHMVRVKG